jgi:hypothetical protein
MLTALTMRQLLLTAAACMSQQQDAESLRLNDTTAAAVTARVIDTLVATSSAMLTDEELTLQHALAEGLQAHTVHNSANASHSDSSGNGNSTTAAAADATAGGVATDTGKHSAVINSVIVPMARYCSCTTNNFQ